MEGPRKINHNLNFKRDDFILPMVFDLILVVFRIVFYALGFKGLVKYLFL